MKSTARLLVTLDCPRQCENCCNKYAMDHMTRCKLKDISLFNGYDAVVITGGEPLLNPILTWVIISKLRSWEPGLEIYLQTAWIDYQISPNVDDAIARIMMNINGITVTMHDDKGLPESIGEYLPMIPSRNRRLRIAPGVTLKRFDVSGFDSIEFIEFVNDDSCVRSDEDLYLLED